LLIRLYLFSVSVCSKFKSYSHLQMDIFREILGSRSSFSCSFAAPIFILDFRLLLHFSPFYGFPFWNFLYFLNRRFLRFFHFLEY